MSWFDNIPVATGPRTPVVHATSLVAHFGSGRLHTHADPAAKPAASFRGGEVAPVTVSAGAPHFGRRGSRGLRQTRSGNDEKSRSADHRILTPWWRQIEAILASWILGPLIFAATHCRANTSR